MTVRPDDRLSLSEHLDELRRRIIVCLVALAAGVVVAAIFDDFVFEALLWPLRQVDDLPTAARRITTFSPIEPFTVSLKIWVAAGLVLASPLLFWELWAYIGPAFAPAKKRSIYAITIATTALFLAGAALAYFVVLPKGLGFLLSFGSGHFNVQNRAADYLTFTALFVLAFGAVFELPVILVLLARLGIIDDRFLRRNRRWAILALAVVAAVITPTQDAFSMLAMFTPLVGLYEVSIWLARVVQPRREVEAGTEDSAGDADASREPA